MMKQKKAQIEGLFYIALFVMVIIVSTVVIMIGSGFLTYTSGIITESVSGLGVIGDTNLTSTIDMTIGIANSGIQMLSYISGIILFFGLLSILLFALYIRMNPSGVAIGLWIFIVIMFVITSIYMSSIYDNFKTGTDEIALELQGMTIGNILMEHLATIITIISFIGGIIIFTGIGDEQQI